MVAPGSHAFWYFTVLAVCAALSETEYCCAPGGLCLFQSLWSFSPGDDCSVFSHELPSYIKDNFESARVTEANWETIQGGAIGSGCGQLAPYAHGDSLYFNGCQIRQAATKPLDLTRARWANPCAMFKTQKWSQVGPDHEFHTTMSTNTRNLNIKGPLCVLTAQNDGCVNLS